MKIEVKVPVNASSEKIWGIISDIENASDNISGIQKVEVLEKPENGLVGLKWKETRTVFGKTATETMWITESVENSHYFTRAESHGAIYISKLFIEEGNGKATLGMSFDAKATSFIAKVMSFLMGWMVKGASKKMLKKDLEDIKALAEKN